MLSPRIYSGVALQGFDFFFGEIESFFQNLNSNTVIAKLLCYCFSVFLQNFLVMLLERV